MPREPKWTVGQTVMIRDANEDRLGGPTEGTVTKVARTLFYVQGRYGGALGYRIEDGTRNDQYGHGWIQTPEDYAAERERIALRERIAVYGLRFDFGASRVSLEALRTIAETLEADAT